MIPQGENTKNNYKQQLLLSIFHNIRTNLTCVYIKQWDFHSRDNGYFVHLGIQCVHFKHFS